ncbi:armadillo/beta-catenin/plakoglobin [Cristinia sonorae]|uniref:uridine/cytidine kinase n=1 Tax=Cristinia sonorae TaxID=1940300 RepID=A0A8K0UM88_9AGAR|nr:armadillo/beta-catenin/plakoglobin [Cristinia sonorae]
MSFDNHLSSLSPTLPMGDEDGIPVLVKSDQQSFPKKVTELGPDTRGVLLQSKKNTILKSHGRSPWYGEDGIPICDAFVVGIGGGSASGKTHVARQIVEKLGSIPAVVILSQDSFYRKHTPEQVALAHQNLVDFDHPDAIDMPLFAACLSDLKTCKQTNIPIYSFSEHQRLDETKYLYGAAIVITEGILALHDPALRALYDLKIFVQCDSDLMLARRLRRDVKERGRTVEGVLDQYLRYVKPSYDNFVLPTARHANIIVPGSDNAVAIELIATHIRRQLKDRSTKLRKQMAEAGPRGLVSVVPSAATTPGTEDIEPWGNLTVLPETSQLKGIYSILRNKDTSRSDFIFFADRLATLLSEKALEHLPYRAKTVTTPVEVEYNGKELDVKSVCGVSILRSGGPLERGLRRVINDVPIGSLLIQSDAQSGEPLLLHLALPNCIRDRSRAEESWIGTAASAFMAIRVLLDHGVRQDRIIFVTFLVARTGGICVLRKAFPQVKVVCGAVDDGLRETWLEAMEEEAGEGQPDHNGAVSNGAERRKVWVVEPGMGHIGDRYYL